MMKLYLQKYVLNLEPRIDECDDFKGGDILVTRNIKFHKIRRDALAAYAEIDLKKEVADAPLQVSIWCVYLKHVVRLKKHV